MRKLAFILLLVATSALSFLLGSAYGFKQGTKNAFLLDPLPQAAISIYRYKKVQENDIDFIKRELNSDVDRSLDLYGHYLTEGNHTYSNIFLSDHINNADRYLKNIANFRMAVPEDDISHVLDDNQRSEYAEMVKKRRALLANYNGNRKP